MIILLIYISGHFLKSRTFFYGSNSKKLSTTSEISNNFRKFLSVRMSCNSILHATVWFCLNLTCFTIKPLVRNYALSLKIFPANINIRLNIQIKLCIFSILSLCCIKCNANFMCFSSYIELYAPHC